MEKMLATAQIGRTHGVDGFVRIHPFSDETEHLEVLDSCLIRTKEGRSIKCTVKDHKAHSDSFLMRFCGYESREKASLLSGGVMYIDRDKGAKLEEGEYYIADLFGLDMICEGEKIGTVESVCDGAQADYLLVRKTDGSTMLVPNMDVFVSKPDFGKGTIELLNGELAK